VEGTSAPISDPQEKICNCICALVFCLGNKWALCCLLMVSVEVSLHFGLLGLHFFFSFFLLFYIILFFFLLDFFLGPYFPILPLLCFVYLFIYHFIFFGIFFNLCQCLSFYSSILSLVS
jgi:hypothetical protein